MKQTLIVLAVIFGILGAVIATTPLKHAGDLDPQAFNTYKKLFYKVLETGDPAKGMIDRYEVTMEDDTDELVEVIKSLAEEYNLRVTGDTKMFTMENNKGKAGEVYKARNISMCAVPIAKRMLQYSMEFGGFMPCRIMIITMGDGKRYLLTMSLDLMMWGGKTHPPEIQELVEEMRTALIEIPKRAAIGDW